MRVVVVDDSAADRNLYRMLLEQAYAQAYAQARIQTGAEERTAQSSNGVDASPSYFPDKGDLANTDSGSGGCAVAQASAVQVDSNVATHLDFDEAATGMEGLRLCRTLAPDCVLLDSELPDMTGMEFLGRLSAGFPADDPAHAVVMLTGLSSERIAVEALKIGAQDYLLKDRITAESLSLAVNKATGKVSLIRALKAERDLLAVSLAEKEVLLKEVHHRVKNNLQVIASLLRLQTEATQDVHLVEILRESQHRVESMALIHEQLYETADLREVDLGRHASLLITKLFNSYGVNATRIECRVDIPPLPLPVDRAIPAGLILNELISNALKHAFPGNRPGRLEVRGGRTGTHVFFEVQDNGVGIPVGIEIDKPRSLGLEIVNILTRQLRGFATLERTPVVSLPLRVMPPRNPGTKLRITFPG